MTTSNQGASRQRYLVNLRTLCFLTRDKQVLLIRGAHDKRLWAGLYNGIGGHVESGEDVYSSCLREIQEETGIKIVEIHLCGIITIASSDNLGVCIFVFRGDSRDEDFRSSKEGSIEWIELEEIPNLPIVPDLLELLPRALSKNHGDPPFFAQYSYNEDGVLSMTYFN